MVGYPIYNDVVDNDSKLSEVIVDYGYVIAFTIILSLIFSPTPANAVDLVTKGAADAAVGKNRTASAIATLLALDTMACGKATNSVAEVQKKVAEKTVSKPKTAAVIVCTAAVVWCARGVVERVVNRHL